MAVLQEHLIITSGNMFLVDVVEQAKREERLSIYFENK